MSNLSPSNYSSALFGPEAEVLQQVFISRYLSVAGYTVLLFDLVSVVWPANWSIVKILFLISATSCHVRDSRHTCQGPANDESSALISFQEVITYYQSAVLALVNGRSANLTQP
ncbi:hypothetical protein CALCODRAFT_505462 [Calocera cornea HHB12733]|uniref:Uncharacterized protein n=1 Tax=Calocera cornea HHB12733 TaxID=1353952 RepID=A0A165K5E9_9BASI|nr:hypothetical protein CALCODRAFT_505462 [Calocera cornea HHB12733]